MDYKDAMTQHVGDTKINFKTSVHHGPGLPAVQNLMLLLPLINHQPYTAGALFGSQ